MFETRKFFSKNQRTGLPYNIMGSIKNVNIVTCYLHKGKTKLKMFKKKADLR